MPAAEITRMTIAEAGRQIEARSLSPVELTEAYLDRIERLNGRINAYVTVTAERARADAARAEREIAGGDYRGPLHGIPIGLKDLFETAGIRTTGGAKFLEHWVPERDGTVVRLLREAGTVLLGKLNTHELAWGTTTNNPHYGPTHNPWKQGYIPGGSSGGSGAAIAAGLAAGTTGSDTGGSIRIPASLCGCVGLKPTYGRVSKAGVLPMSWMIDHAGPITQTVEDAALMLQVMAGYDPADFSSVRCPVDDYRAGLNAGVGGLRIGVLRGYFTENASEDTVAAFDAAVGELRRLGAEMREVESPVQREQQRDWGVVTVAESQAYHAEMLKERPQDFSPQLTRILSREVPSGLELAAALQRRYRLTEAFQLLLQEVDLLVSPSTLAPASPIGADPPDLSACAWPFNVSHLPALSVPCGFSRDGLPIGLQLVGRPFDEALLLRAGHAYEQATPWHDVRPQGLD